MRMRRVRYSVRLMLVVVAVVGIALGAFVITSRRRATFSERAWHHAWEIFGIEEENFPDPAWEKFWFSDDPDESRPQGATFHPPGWEPPSEEDSPAFKSWRLSQARRIAYHEAMIKKYTHAARYPWLPVPSDPPETE
ncbi:MAG: hypothetical protein ACHRXM_03275 [Isosphaerales bacterium]